MGTEEYDVFRAKPSLKNRLLATLTDEWQSPKDILPSVADLVSLTYCGVALRSLVRLGLADLEIKWDKPKYRRGTGQTTQIGAVRKERRRVTATTSSPPTPSKEEPSTPSKTLPASTVIPAGADYLVFTNIAKVRKIGPERVTVFWAVEGSEYNLSTDEYEGRAAQEIIEAFEQRLHGWVSITLVKDLKAKITENEQRIAQLQNELAKTRKKISKFREALDE